MNNLLERTGATTTQMDEHISSFYGLTTKVLGDLGDLAGRSSTVHGRSLVEAVDLLDKSNRRTEDVVNERRTRARQPDDRRSTPAPRISISGSSASPPCSTSRSPRRKAARATSPASSPKRARKARARSPSSTRRSA